MLVGSEKTVRVSDIHALVVGLILRAFILSVCLLKLGCVLVDSEKAAPRFS